MFGLLSTFDLELFLYPQPYDFWTLNITFRVGVSSLALSQELSCAWKDV